MGDLIACHSLIGYVLFLIDYQFIFDYLLPGDLELFAPTPILFIRLLNLKLNLLLNIFNTFYPFTFYSY